MSNGTIYAAIIGLASVGALAIWHRYRRLVSEFEARQQQSRAREAAVLEKIRLLNELWDMRDTHPDAIADKAATIIRDLELLNEGGELDKLVADARQDLQAAIQRSSGSR